MSIEWKDSAAPGHEEGTSAESADEGGIEPGHTTAREWFKSIVIGFVLFLGVRAFALEAFRIPTGSMEGTLLTGDFVLVNKAVYGVHLPFTDLVLPGFASPERGDVIVFRPPHDTERDYVKRLVGVPGDTIEMADRRLLVNGKQIVEPYAHCSDRPDAFNSGGAWQCSYMTHAFHDDCHPSRNSWGPLVVPSGQYFVLGDNRDDSEDSRYWGFVPREAINGRPSLVYFSLGLDGAGGTGRRARVRWNRIGRPVH